MVKAIGGERGRAPSGGTRDGAPQRKKETRSAWRKERTCDGTPSEEGTRDGHLGEQQWAQEE
jgi:hypothetical protein